MAGDFVPAADEVWRLQQDDDPECRFFRKVITGKPGLHRGTLQGIYIFTPSGKLLARRNSNSPTHIMEIMKHALSTWSKMSEDQRYATAKNFQPKFRWEDSYPTDGLVLSRSARDLPKDGKSTSKTVAPFNRDSVWFSQKEARQWLPHALEVGARHTIPSTLAKRMASVALVDNVRGQTLPFHDTEVRGTALQSEITEVRGSMIELRITGTSHASADGSWLFGTNYWKPRHEHKRSLTTQVLGKATFNSKANAFVAFQLIALGERRGRTGLNGRGSDVGPGGIGFSFHLANKNWRVAPTFINVYGASWVKMPGQ